MDKQNEYYQICNDQWLLLSKNLKPESADSYWGTLLEKVTALYQKHNKTEYAIKSLAAAVGEIYRLERSGKVGDRQHYLMVCKEQWELMKQFSDPENPPDDSARIDLEVSRLQKKYEGDPFALEVFQVSRQELERIQLESRKLKCPEDVKPDSSKTPEQSSKKEKPHIRR